MEPAPSPAPVLTLDLYTKADCPLCEAMKAELRLARVEPPFRLEEVDIERDPDLHARYALSIPVVEFAGRTLAKGRTTAAEFERRYARLQAEIRQAQISTEELSTAELAPPRRGTRIAP
jgi:glutaredoxin